MASKIGRWLLFTLLCVSYSFANQAATGFCQTGGVRVVTVGETSTTNVQGSFPSCTVTVNNLGGGLATIFSDNLGTPLSNPFTAGTNGSWLFYANNGHYTITTSASGFVYTYSDILLNDPAATSITQATVTANGFISSSANPSSTGIFRAASSDSAFCFRNFLNTNDICIKKTGAATANQPANMVDLTGFGAVEAGSFETSTVAPAVGGVLACAAADNCVNIRNQTNTADIVAISKDSSDRVVVGGAAGLSTAGINDTGAAIISGGLTTTTGTFSGSISGTGATFTSEVAPSITGVQLGDTAHRWDLFARNIDWTGTFTGGVMAATSLSLTGSLTVTGPSSLASVTATTGIFSGLITPNGGIAAFNGVTGDFINAGVFTNAAPNPNLQSIINSCSLTTEETALFGVSAFTSEAVTGCLQIPNTSTAAAFGSGASGYANTSSTTTPAVGIFGGGRALVNNSKAWGGNVIAQDVAGLTTGVALVGFEVDVTPTNASTAYTSVNGVPAIIGAGAHTGTFGDAHVATSNKAGATWTNGFHSGAGAATQALTADKLASAGVTASQPIVFVSNNGGADITASLATDSAGDFVATLPASGFFQASRMRIPEETTAFPSLHDATTTNTGLNFRGGVLELVKAGTASLQAFGAGVIVDTEIRFALGSVDVTSPTAGIAECASGVVCASNVGNNSNGVFKAASFTSGGTAAGLTGTGACATFSTQSGGAMAGQATCTGVTAGSTLTITPGTTAPNGWVCHVQDQTTRANLFQQTGNNATTCTLTATSVTQNDVFVFTAIAF